MGNFVCGVFVDLENAFDTVIHKILCDKLNYYGLRGIVNTFISIDGYDSLLRDLNCGVPQGSSLGPWLFLLYINDFRLCLHMFESGYFADDTYILLGSNKLGTIESKISFKMAKIEQIIFKC